MLIHPLYLSILKSQISVCLFIGMQAPEFWSDAPTLSGDDVGIPRMLYYQKICAFPTFPTLFFSPSSFLSFLKLYIYIYIYI